MIAAGSPASRPSSVGSAQWMSSTMTTRGRVPAWARRKWRIAHSVSGAVAEPSARPSSCAIFAATTRNVRRALDVCLDEGARLRDRVLVVDAGQLPHDLADGPEGDSFPVGKAPAAHDPRPGADLRDELGGQA